MNTPDDGRTIDVSQLSQSLNYVTRGLQSAPTVAMIFLVLRLGC